MKRLLLLLIIFLVTGCWNYKELNELAIVSALAIEKKDEEFHITAQIMNAKKTNTENASITGGGESPVTTLESQGKTMHEAIRNMALVAPRKLYIGHANLLIIDEEVAYDGVEEIIDYMIRDPESRKQFQVLLAKNIKASTILKLLPPMESLPTQDILSTLSEASKHVGVVTEITYDEFLSILYASGIEPTLPVITIIGDKEGIGPTTNTQNTTPKASFKLLGMAVFKKDKLLGFLNEETSLGYNLIRNNITYEVVSYDCGNNNYASIEIVDINTNFKVKINKNKPKIYITTTGVGYLSEINCKIDITLKEEKQKINMELNKTIKEKMGNSIEFVQEQYGSDIFGFGHYLYQENYSYWEKNEKKWNQLFSDMEYEINVDIAISKKGSTIDSAREG